MAFSKDPSGLWVSKGCKIGKVSTGSLPGVCPEIASLRLCIASESQWRQPRQASERSALVPRFSSTASFQRICWLRAHCVSDISRPMVLNQKQVCPTQGTLGNGQRQFWLSQLRYGGRGASGSVGRSGGCCLHSTGQGTGPTVENPWVPVSVMLTLRNPVVDPSASLSSLFSMEQIPFGDSSC